MARAGNDYAAFIAWLRMSFATILVVLLMTTLFYHTALGLQVVIEDYVHSGMKIPVLLSVRYWLFCAGRRRHLGDPADRTWRLRGDVGLRRSPRMAAELSAYLSWRLT